MEAKPLKALLADRNVSFDATTILNALVKSGHAENSEYASTTGSGQLKSFKRLTESGMQFGTNKSTMHPLKTEPRFYEETFPELLKVVVTQLHHEVTSL
ncbi:hypothetical protein HX867_08010 [Pseudomonas gingeri]|uniref:hypothetical protein n=1 Tax=Pseudomonas gingeri TaxID=117681 RepID=UPI0015A326E0|nr:hypothetical protein [Pseudomonas gingeri]NVZ62023.1 hypothetical protein [Pseudomonas gingeri]